MAENRTKYILLYDCVCDKYETNSVFKTSVTRTQVLKGEILEALSPHRVALVGVARKNVSFGNPASDCIARLTDEESDLLLAVTSVGGRHQIYHERYRLDAGKRLKEGSRVLVKVRGLSEDLPGVLRYKGPIETSSGTMFGVELTDHAATCDTTDGVFENKRYFRCPPDSGVFVSLDKLTVLEYAESKTSPKRTEDSKGKFAVWKDKLLEILGASGSTTEGAERIWQKDLNHIKRPLRLDQKVIVLLENDKRVRGSVRHVGLTKDSQGRWYSFVGVELEERCGRGTGMFQGKQLFVCKSGFAKFVSEDSVIPVVELENKTGEREKARTEDDIPYNTRYQDKLKKEAAGNHRDKTPRPKSYIDANRPRAEASRSLQSFRRSSASSSTSTDDIEIIKIAHLGMNFDGSNKDLIVQDQRRILDEIKQTQWEKTDTKYVKPRIAELMNLFEDHHYSSGGRPITDQAAGLPQEKVDKYELQEAQFASPSDHLTPVPVLTMEPGLVSNTKERQLEEQRTELSEVTNTKERQLEELRTELNDVTNTKERQLEELRMELSEVTNTKERQLEELRTELSEVTKTKERQLEDIRAELNDVTSTKERQLKELRTELNDVTNMKERQLEELRMELNDVTNTKERQLEELRTELSEVTNTKERQLEDIRAELNDVISTKERQLKELRTELNDVTNTKERQLEELRTELNDLTNSNEIITELISTKERQLEDIRVELNDVTSTKERHIEDLRTELNEMSGTNERLERLLQQERENLERELDELRNRVEPLAVDWTVNRDEIRLTDTHLGKGGWASVKVGVFRGMKVAVKQIHELILSDYNRNLFAREMRMASRCRHPCLLQFIGATNDDGQSPLLLTEILDTSLRSVLSDRSLSVEEVLPIALDVGKALNYLHLNQPEPIIHRDISSANVLLWQKGDGWRAKVSDYGTANFMRQCGTVSPGAPLYVAPEALDVARQSPKMDVYSFGILLCEMCIRELPDPQRRLEQIGRVQHAEMRDLVTRCVRRKPRDRPDMAAVLRELETLEQRR